MGAVITYYRDRTVEVTSDAIHIHGRQFELSDLEYVWHREAEPDAPRKRGRRLGKLLLLLAGAIVAVVAAYFIALAVGEPSQLRAVLIALVVAVLLVGLAGPLLEIGLDKLDDRYDRGTATHEIWAIWRGKELMLLRISDITRFGRIYRSIQRAMEPPVVPPSPPTEQ